MYENEWKEHKFRQKKIEKSDFYKFKKIFNIDVIDVNKMLVSKNEPYSKKKKHLNTLLDIKRMMLLDHYV